MQHVVQIKNGIKKHINGNVKIISAKQTIVGILMHKNSNYWKSVTDTSVIACVEIASVMDISKKDKYSNKYNKKLC